MQSRCDQHLTAPRCGIGVWTAESPAGVSRTGLWFWLRGLELATNPFTLQGISSQR